jgi:ketosteroid isomerase-like protein
MNNSVAIAQQFVALINAHDVEGLVNLLSADHRFTDSLGNEFLGAETMRLGWQSYFAMVPNYSIQVTATLEAGDMVVMLGTAGGTYTADGRLLSKNAWIVPVALRVRILTGKVAEWQVYADNEPMRQCIAHANRGQPD